VNGFGIYLLAHYRECEEIASHQHLRRSRSFSATAAAATAGTRWRQSTTTDIACFSFRDRAGTDNMSHASVWALDDMDAHAAEDQFPDHQTQLGRKLRQQRALQLDVPVET
jgi:hypothetical protein